VDDIICIFAFEIYIPLLMQYQFITTDAGILGGKPIIKGTRISVELILEWLANGSTIGEINKEFPQLSPEAIKEAIRYAAELSGRDYYLEIKVA